MIRAVATAAAVLLGCIHTAPPVEESAGAEELPAVEVTRWTQATELFMEHAPLRAGQTSRFAIHLTSLTSFQPILEGVVTVELAYGGNDVERFSADGPSRPGIFGVDVAPSRPGRPSMAIRLRSAGMEDAHLLGETRVLSAGEGAVAADAAGEPPAAGAAVPFLKEQQWVLDFATAIVGTETMSASVRVPAVVETRTGARLTVTAPVSGMLMPGARLPGLGAWVKKDEELCLIAPLWPGPLDQPSLEQEAAESGHLVEAAEREQERIERLLAAGAVPGRRLQTAETALAVAKARHKAARERLALYEASQLDEASGSSGLEFSVRSHHEGVILAQFVSEGEHVQAGDALLEIADVRTVHVRGIVPESQAALLVDVQRATVEMPDRGSSRPTVDFITRSPVVDPATRTLGITYLVGNRGLDLAIGQSVFLRLFTSRNVTRPTIPQAALVDHGGQTVVYVQRSGESFERRPVRTGNRRGERVQVEEGLGRGDRIVTVGAHLLRLAENSPQAPAHGHVH